MKTIPKKYKSWTIREEYIPVKGKKYGPYLYAYKKFNGKLLKRYIGKIGQKVQRREQPGFTYIVQKRDEFKIGYSINPIKRIANIVSISGENIQIICLLKTDYPKSLERLLHQTYRNKKTNHEWYALTKQDIIAITNIKHFQGKEVIHDS